MAPWEFEREGEVITLDPPGPLVVRIGEGVQLAVEAAVAGTGVIQLFDDWLQPYFDAGTLEPLLEPWWSSFTGPFLYYPSRTWMPAPLRAFVDFVRASQDE